MQEVTTRTSVSQSVCGKRHLPWDNCFTVSAVIAWRSGGSLANDSRVLFGIGKEESIQEIRVRWPSGIEQVIATPRPHQFLKVMEPSSPAVPPAVSSAPDTGSKPLPAAEPSSAGQSGKPAPSTSSTSQVSSVSPDSSSLVRKAQASPTAVVKYRLAETLVQQGRAAEAAEALNAAIQLQPDFLEAHFILGVMR